MMSCTSPSKKKSKDTSAILDGVGQGFDTESISAGVAVTGSFRSSCELAAPFAPASEDACFEEGPGGPPAWALHATQATTLDQNVLIGALSGDAQRAVPGVSPSASSAHQEGTNSPVMVLSPPPKRLRCPQLDLVRVPTPNRSACIDQRELGISAITSSPHQPGMESVSGGRADGGGRSNVDERTSCSMETECIDLC